MIVAGDIGGTHARLGTFSENASQTALVRAQVFPSRDYKNLVDVVRAFLGGEKEPVRVFCFGVAGPVHGGIAHPTNLEWVLDERQMTAELGAPVVLINDLEANAYGVATLGAGDIATLQEGEPGKPANQCVVAAGTGLGEAGLFWDGAAHRPFACEGGHTSFSPGNAEEIALLEYLLRHLDHVSWERLLSGPGLHNIYKFLRDTGRGAEPASLAERIQQADPASVIAESGLHGESELCVRALDLFVSLYGSEAGNMALKTLSFGGCISGAGLLRRFWGSCARECSRNRSRLRAGCMICWRRFLFM